MKGVKQIISAALCFVLISAVLTGCNRRDTQSDVSTEDHSESVDPSSQEAESLSPDHSDTQETPDSESFYQDILLTYGGQLYTDDDGTERMRVLKGISLYYGEDWDSVSELDNRTFYSWYLTTTWREDLSDEEREAKYGSPFGEGTGWFFPQEYYEPLVQEYFAVDTELLRSDPVYYHEEYQGYHVDGHAGIGATPFIILDHTEQDGDMLKLSFRIHYEEEWEPDVKKVMTVRLRPDGGYYYESVKSADI